MNTTETYRPMADLIAGGAREHGGQVYIKSVDQGGKELTYTQLLHLTNRIAHFLARQGLGPADRVLLLSDNSIEFVLLYLGVLRYGATLAAVNVDANRQHLAAICRAIDPKLVFYEDGHGLDALSREAPGTWRPLGEWREDGSSRLFAELEDFSPDYGAAPLCGPDDPAVIFYTSGTVARPKGVIYSHRVLFYNFDAVGEWVGLQPGDRILDFRPYSWCSAMEMGLGGPLLRGATVIMARRFSRSRYFEWIAEHKVNVAVCVPTAISRLLGDPVDVAPGGLSSLRFVVSSSAALLEEHWRAFEARYGARVIQGYGSSEGGWTCGQPPNARKFGTVGPPLKHQLLWIADAGGERLPNGAIGEIVVDGGKQQASGFLSDQGEVQIRDPAPLRTGDLGYLDEDGHLVITGRAKDIIIRGGVNIAPLEIDAVLASHPAVAEAATVGVPDQAYGEEVVSYIALKPGAAASAEELSEHCRRRLPEFKTPKAIIFADSLPKTARGKLDRKVLVEQWHNDRAR